MATLVSGSKSARLVLIRHAESDCGSRLCGCYDPPLTGRGCDQVGKLRDRLASPTPVAAVYSSPLRRTLSTAAAAPSLPDVVDDLREIYCGDLDGLPLSDVANEFRDLWDRNLAQTEDDFRWPSGESYREFRARVLAGLSSIAARHSGERVLVFTHAGVINQTIGAIRGFRPAQWEPYRPGHASLTEIEWRGHSGSLLVFNDRNHLNGTSSAG